MNTLYTILLIALFGAVSAANQLVIDCGLDDPECSLQIISSLFECDAVFTNTSDPYQFQDGVVVPYPEFNVTVYVNEANVTGISNSTAMKMVKDYDRDETLLVVYYGGIVIKGNSNFSFPKDGDFDVLITNAAYNLTYFETRSSIVFKGTENINLTSGRVYNNPFVSTIPLLTVDQKILDATKTEANVASVVQAVVADPVGWIQEQVDVIGHEFLRGFFNSYSCACDLLICLD